MTPSPLELAQWFAFAGRALLSADAAHLRESIEELSATPAVGMEPLVRALADSLPEQSATLETEYIRLFLNPIGSPCLLWQSTREQEARMMGASHHSALAWYRAAGIEPQADNEPADHAGLLLSFYARLLRDGADATERARFVHEHLLWLPALGDELDRETHLAFYRDLSRLLRLLVDLETPS